MAYTVNWVTKVISVPTSDLTLVSGTRYSLDLFAFLAEVRRLEWEFTGGLWAPAILDHSNTRFDFAGSNYAAFDGLINGYTWQVTGAATRVDLLNSNNDLVDNLINTGVSVVPSNSTGLTYSKQTQDLSYEGARIWVDTVNGTVGQIYPTGTPGQPAKTFADAIAIAAVRGLPNRYRGLGAETVTSGSLNDFDLLGAGADLSAFTIDPGVTTDRLVCEDIAISGTLNGSVVLKGCTTGTLYSFSGEMIECALRGGVEIDLAASGTVSMHRCNSEVAGVDRPTLNVNSTSADIIVDRYTGGIYIVNMTAGNSMTINCNGASVRIGPSCTNGTIKIRGNFALENQSSAPGLTVLIYENREDSAYERVEKVWTRLDLDATNPQTYADDDSSITNDDFTLTKTSNDDGTSTVNRS